MSNRKNTHRRRLRVAVLAVVCGAVFAAFFARLAWMQFARADYYADKAAEAKVIQAEAEAKVAQATELVNSLDAEAQALLAEEQAAAARAAAEQAAETAQEDEAQE